MPSFFVGAYTADMDGEATGIAVLDSRDDGSLVFRSVEAATESPSYLAAGSGELFAVAEATGRVTKFTRGDGTALLATASVSSGGEAPCQLTLTAESVLVANYTSGTIGVIDRAGLELVEVLTGTGSGPHEAQDGPHAHSTHVLADGVVLSADLGADRIHRHSVAGGRLVRVSSVEVPAGTGPRDFHEPVPGVLWVLGELSCELLVFAVTADGLDLVSVIGIPGAEPGDHAAAIAVSDDGGFVYVGLRGSNRVAWFTASPDSLELEPQGSVASGGDFPRHLLIEGNFLHVANQLSSTVSTFDTKKNGRPELVREPEPVPSPTFLLRA